MTFKAPITTEADNRATTMPHTFQRDRPYSEHRHLSLHICARVFTRSKNCYENNIWYIVKPAISGHSKRRPKLVFKTDYSLIQVKSIAKCLKNILQ